MQVNYRPGAAILLGFVAKVKVISDTVVTREAILFVVVLDWAVASFVVRHLLMVKGGRQ